MTIKKISKSGFSLNVRHLLRLLHAKIAKKNYNSKFLLMSFLLRIIGFLGYFLKESFCELFEKVLNRYFLLFVCYIFIICKLFQFF